jgi:glycosyltransferase involved in cell wall biosynthesis
LVTGRTLSIVMLTTFYPPFHFGGDAVYVQLLARLLAEAGHRVTVVHCVDSFDLLGGSPVEAAPEHPGVRVVPIRTRVGRLSPIVTYVTGSPGPKLPILRRVLVDERPDVVHLHNSSLIGPGAASLGEATRLQTLHEHWLVCPTHVLWRDNREVCPEPRCARCLLAYRRPPQPWRATGARARYVEAIDLFLAPSRFVVEEHRRRGLELDAVVLPYAARHNAEPAAVRQRPYVLFAGRLEPMKGVDDLLDAAAAYRDVDVVVAGDGSAADDLRRRGASLPHVRFLGHLRAAELAPLLRGALATVIPSRVQEVGPVVAVESLAAGTPIVGRRRGGVTEVVEESGAGLLFDDAAGLARALERVHREEPLRRELADRAVAAWRARHSPDVHLHAYLAAVDDATRRRSARAR